MSNATKQHPDVLADFDAPIARVPAWTLRESAPKIACPEAGDHAHVSRGSRTTGKTEVRAIVLTNGDAQTGMPLCAFKYAIRGRVISLIELAGLVAPEDRDKLAKLLVPAAA